MDCDVLSASCLCLRIGVLLHLGKLVTLLDLTNIATNLRLKADSHGKDLQDVISKLRQDPSITVDVFTDKKHNLLGIFYQDKTMKDMFHAFPDMFPQQIHRCNTQVEVIKDATLCISNL